MLGWKGENESLLHLIMWVNFSNVPRKHKYYGNSGLLGIPGAVYYGIKLGWGGGGHPLSL